MSDAQEIEDALEHGFAELMTLEARLQKATDPRAANELREEIDERRAALTKLRARTDPEVSAPLALGFVLPQKR